MIKANELRIGNLVLVNEVIFKINAIQDKCLYFNSWINNSDNIQPIELTEEWLIKFGFKKGINDWFTSSFVAPIQDSATMIYINVNSGSACLTDFDDREQMSYIGSKIKYVHQLQNLYFCLTGEELKIN